jgi:hypothetical protein
MTSRLRARVQRLEQGGWFADFAQRCLRVLREAATAVELPPTAIEQLCTAFDAHLDALRTTMPAWIKVGPQMAHLGKQMVQLLQDLVERQVDASQRPGLYAALRQAFEREANR